MEEKERYEVMSPSLNGYAYIHDLKTDNVLNTYDSCDLLNQQSKRIKELENENKQLHDLPNKIVEEIKLQLFNHFKVKNIEEYEKLPLIDSLFTADTVIKILDEILKKYGGEDESLCCNVKQ